MSGELPSAWAQFCPRSVRLAPSGILVPAATLKALLQGGRSQELVYCGHGLEPAVRDGDLVRVSGRDRARRGDLVLCEVDGWCDLLRCLRRSSSGGCTLALDAFPARYITLEADRILGVERPARPSLARGLAVAGLLSWRAPAASVRFRWRRVTCAPDFADGEAGDASVLEKYRQQVKGYRTLRRSMLSEDLARLLAARVPAGGAILVGGSGVGTEAIHLAGLGFRVTGFDALPEMVSASEEEARAAGYPVEFIQARIAGLDLAERRFDAVYLTPLLLSFIAGRQRRIATLRRMARHLRPGGCLLFSVRPFRNALERIETALAVALRRRRGSRSVEPGDWYTWFLTPQGTIGCSYLHRFASGEVEAELEAAGLRVAARVAGHILAEPSAGTKTVS